MKRRACLPKSAADSCGGPPAAPPPARSSRFFRCCAALTYVTPSWPRASWQCSVVSASVERCVSRLSAPKTRRADAWARPTSSTRSKWRTARQTALPCDAQTATAAMLAEAAAGRSRAMAASEAAAGAAAIAAAATASAHPPASVCSLSCALVRAAAERPSKPPTSRQRQGQRMAMLAACAAATASSRNHVPQWSAKRDRAKAPTATHKGAVIASRSPSDERKRQRKYEAGRKATAKSHERKETVCASRPGVMDS
mmetsp:Transcript_32335/g.104627  ORF Transcript_32335/g.104627 Transcript_32335/m.104627 type:complete len:255 (-) Transcript_32335:9-773(-)